MASRGMNTSLIDFNCTDSQWQKILQNAWQKAKLFSPYRQEKKRCQHYYLGEVGEVAKSISFDFFQITNKCFDCWDNSMPK